MHSKQAKPICKTSWIVQGLVYHGFVTVCLLFFNNVCCCVISLSSVWTSGGVTGRSWPQSAPSAAMSRTWSRESRWWENFSFTRAFSLQFASLPVFALALMGTLLHFQCVTMQPHDRSLLKEQFLLLFADCHCAFDCRDSATKCVPCTPISPSTLSSRRAAPWWKSGTSWERNTFVVSEWELVRQDAETQTLNCFLMVNALQLYSTFLVSSSCLKMLHIGLLLTHSCTNG